jgi:hypothetical protein
MKHATCLATVALIAALCVAGCGQDNGRGNDNNTPGGPTATPGRTTAPPTSTPTSGVALTATPTSGETGAGTPTPTIASTPGANACVNTTLTITSGSGSILDTGWTGIAHNQPTLEDTKVSVNLVNCQDNGDCTVDGSAFRHASSTPSVQASPAPTTATPAAASRRSS